MRHPTPLTVRYLRCDGCGPVTSHSSDQRLYTIRVAEREVTAPPPETVCDECGHAQPRVVGDEIPAIGTVTCVGHHVPGPYDGDRPFTVTASRAVRRILEVRTRRSTRPVMISVGMCRQISSSAGSPATSSSRLGPTVRTLSLTMYRPGIKGTPSCVIPALSMAMRPGDSDRSSSSSIPAPYRRP